MKIISKKIISLILCILMCISIMPVSALGADSAAASAPAVTYAAKNAAAPKVTANPKSVTTSLKEKVKLTVTAKGKKLKYQWYYRTSTTGSWKKLSGKTKATLTLTATKKLNGYQYRCQVSNSGGKVYSKAATLKVLNFTIKTHPKDVTVTQGDKATFKIKVSGSGLKYQWQYRTSASGSWKKLSGKTKATLTITTAKKNDGYQYRCRITNSKGSTYTKAATLHVYGFTITTQPRDQFVQPGETAVFSTDADGTVDSYQWYCRAGENGTWQAVTPDGKGKTLSVTAAPKLSGYQYRCCLTDSAGSIYTSVATLTVADFTITGQPEDLRLRPGAAAEFSVTADGAVTGWQWQVRTSASGAWTALSGQTGSKLTLTAESGMNGYEYRCLLTSAKGSAYSRAAVLRVLDLAVTAQPADATARVGENAVFTVAARGEELTYQWYSRATADGEWTALSGETGATLSLPVETDRDGQAFRCEIIDPLGSVTSDAAVLRVINTRITAQPAGQTLRPGSTASFSVEAEGEDLAYQWQVRTSADGTWTALSGETGTVLTLAAESGMNRYEYRCEIRDAAGSLPTQAAVLRVLDLAVTTQPADATVRVEETAAFTVEARGEELTYQWYSRASADGEWTALSGQTGATLSLAAGTDLDGQDFRCEITDPLGSVTSEAARLHVINTHITAQPADRTVAAGESVTFTVAVEGDVEKYEWYYRTPSNQEWKALNNTNKPSYTMSALAGHDSFEFRCEVTDELGTLTSEPALLRVVSVTTPPADATVRVGKSASFTVKARGPVESYRWQYRDGADGTWTDLDGQSERTLTFTAEKSKAGYEYRCGLVYDGGVLYSDSAVLDVYTATYRALLVGEVHFDGWQTDPKDYLANRNKGDVEMMRTMLQGIQGPEEAPYAVTTLFDASTAQIGAAIQSTFAGATEDDVSLFFIASHGVTNVASGGDAGAILTIDENGHDEYLTMPQLAAWLNAVPGKVIVFIGSCGSGAAVYSNGLRSIAADETADFTQSVVSAFSAYGNRSGLVSNTGELRTSKFYVLTAAAHMESSYGWEGDSPYNAFTYYLTLGVNGAMPADVGNDGSVNLQELYNYVYTGVMNDNRLSGVEQHVQVYPENSVYPLFKK